MTHRLDDFVVGVVATFGRCFHHRKELDDLAQAASEFYLDLHGLPHGTLAQLPFWRYLIHASGVLVDQAASSGEDQLDNIQGAELEAARAMTSYWPFLATMVTRQYRRAAPPSTATIDDTTARISTSTAEVGVQTEENPPLEEDLQSDTDGPASYPAGETLSPHS